MKNDELSLLEELNKRSQMHFLKGEQAAALSCWQEARAIQIVHHTGDFSILEDTVQMHEQELINMAQFFYDNEKEDWGGILANMVALFRAMSISGPMSDRVKTQKNRECAQGQRKGDNDIKWADIIEEIIVNFEKDKIKWTKDGLIEQVEMFAHNQGVECISSDRIEKIERDVCERCGYASRKPGAPEKGFSDDFLDAIINLIQDNPKAGADTLLENLQKVEIRSDKAEVRRFLKNKKLDNKNLRLEFVKQNSSD